MQPPSRSRTASEIVHDELDHPVIDADGHYIEFMPALATFLAEEGVDDPASLFADVGCGLGTGGYDAMSREERARRRAVRTPWWALPAENTLDLATATIPALLHERLGRLGIDFAILYPSAGLAYPHVRDERRRRAACRAQNRYVAEVFSAYADRLAPAAVIPMHGPDEATEELEFATGELGLKTAMIAGFVERPVPDPDRGPDKVYFDTYGIDSPFDYDPFWRRCVELGVSVATHSGSMGIGFRRSISTYMYNHIGHFGTVGEALAKSLFLGGVTRRFPRLRVACLEGGVHWAVALFADLVARFEKRNREAVRTYDPARIDREMLSELLAKYGGGLLSRSTRPAEVLGWLEQDAPVDDFAALGIERGEELAGLFARSFAFGCEADDPMTATAFDRARIPFDAPIQAMFSSDIGHWDVPDMAQVLAEAYENVERGWLDAEAFRDFTFGNAARFYTDANPDFFRGTAVERAVAEHVGRASGA